MMADFTLLPVNPLANRRLFPRRPANDLHPQFTFLNRPKRMEMIDRVTFAGDISFEAPPNSLNYLARRRWVADGYSNVNGEQYKVDADVMKQVLRHWGVPEAHIQTPALGIQAIDNEEWTTPIDPVQVVRQVDLAEPKGLPIVMHLTNEQLNQPLSWTFTTESGKAVSGEMTPSHSFTMGRAHEKNTIDGTEYNRITITVPIQSDALEWGYHDLTLTPKTGDAHKPVYGQKVIITPSECYTPNELKDDGRVWAPAVQLYSLRSGDEYDFGIGDFRMLKQFAKWVKPYGASMIALNPIGPRNLVHPEGASPYSPSSRFFTNPLYIDIPAVPGFDAWRSANTEKWRAIQDGLKSTRAQNMVAYKAVADAKLGILNEVFTEFAKRPATDGDVQSFAAYKKERGDDLTRFAMFQAIQEYKGGSGWQDWEDPFRTLSKLPVDQAQKLLPPAVNERLPFFMFMQWRAEEDIKEVKKVVGLYMDLTVGVDRGGFDTWRDPEAFALGISVGCPPDALGPKGQNWGLPPYAPKPLRQMAYKPYIDTIRNSMRHAKALRGDHVAGFNRLFWIPEGEKAPYRGAYVYYNFEELFGILALESHRNKTLVIGEDLGTVPSNVRPTMEKWNVYAYKVARWERQWKEEGQPFTPPDKYDAKAAAAYSTHDVATIWGMFTGWFFKRCEELGVMKPEEAVEKRAGEDAGLSKFVDTLRDAQLIDDAVTMDTIRSNPEHFDAFTKGAYTYLAQTQSKVALVPMEDLTKMEAQVNMPGTCDGPMVETATEERMATDLNWRRQLPKTLSELENDPLTTAIFTMFQQQRPLLTTSGKVNPPVMSA